LRNTWHLLRWQQRLRSSAIDALVEQFTHVRVSGCYNVLTLCVPLTLSAVDAVRI
jgi:hypothetical protein